MTVVAAACSRPPIDPTAATDIKSTTTTETTAPASEASGGITASQIDGVWVFQYEPETGMSALHSGVAEIVSGCLVIDGFIVIWPTASMEDAAAAVAAARTGANQQVMIGGGGMGALRDEVWGVVNSGV
ncbi:MAG: hypothetical protein U9N84_04605 [Actinomycetota bacterium]|nr:hypothetical protein [Actinomycetota bacterium]